MGSLMSISFQRMCLLASCMFFISATKSLVSSQGFSTETDKLALLAFKKYLVDGVLSSWNESYNFCHWQGVTCGNSHQRVIGLDLASLGFAGSLPPSIGNLTFLRRINFADNGLRGVIPKEVGLLPRLEYLNLSINALGGSIPLELMNCTNLQTIDISSNSLTGSIPPEIEYLSKLLSLRLQKNNLTGSIPSSIGHLSQLLHLWAPSNNLTGSMPASIGNLSSLVLLSFGSNFIEGEIPPEIGQLKNLTRLRLYDNRLSGTIPSSLYNLSSAIEISVAGNNLFGEFMPTSMLNVPSLISLIVGYNEFTGNIPAGLVNISTLGFFDAPSNNLTGQLPRNLGMLKNLERFNVEYNDLGAGTSGDLDFLTSISNASFLSVLGLQTNRLGGQFPASYFNSTTQLTRVTFGSNRISGSIPEGIGNQINLIQLGMENNDLSGTIPYSVGNLIMAELLDFHGNRLSGNIPDLRNLSRLFFLSVAGNSLEGVIPVSLKQCNLLQTLLLSENKLSGEIPRNFLNHFNQLITLELHQNLLSGTLPAEVGSLKNLGNLSISDNKLSGEIPEQLGDCSGLEFLEMAGNLFQGSIPSSLSKLRGLQFLDISRNNLAGSIPTELGKITGMWYLNLSYNHLVGQVPLGGVFENSSGFFFYGNDKLCGGIPQLLLPKCSVRSQKALSTIATILIVLGCLACLAIVVTCFVLNRRTKAKTESSSAALVREGMLRVTYKDLHHATSGFDSSNLIGMGSFGSVYKGLLFDERIPVAIKVLNFQKHGASKSFLAECKSLGTIRHRNLLKILTACSSLDRKGVEFMALVFELMPNGSLESWLHGSRNLAFTQRLEIAIDIASALNYLHNGCETPIVHCDLKPSNVLLDQDMVAHVGDFGLAKVLFVASSSQSKDQSSSYAVKGSVGYIPPEYGMSGKVSTQGDRYSFGILVLEMFTGMRPTDGFLTDNVGGTLHEYVKRALPEGAREIADSRLLAEFDERSSAESVKGKTYEESTGWESCLVSILEIGIACSVENQNRRMDMADARNALIELKNRILEMGPQSTPVKIQESSPLDT